jgi:hypothetical protein
MKELEKLVAFVRPFVAMEIELCKNYLFAFWLMGSTTRCCKAKNHRCSLFPALRLSPIHKLLSSCKQPLFYYLFIGLVMLSMNYEGHRLVLNNIVNGSFARSLYLVAVSLSFVILQTPWIDFDCLLLGLPDFYNYLSIQLLYMVLKLCPAHFSLLFLRIY